MSIMGADDRREHAYFFVDDIKTLVIQEDEIRVHKYLEKLGKLKDRTNRKK